MELHVTRVAINAFANRTADSAIPAEKYPMVHAAVLAACDALDGVKDGVIDNPTACKFDPSVLACKGADGPSCLTGAQVETMRALYAPIKNARGAIVSPPLLQPGTELAFATLAGPKPLGLANEAMQYVVFKDAAWDWHHFNPATDIDMALRSDEQRLEPDRSEPEAVLRSRRQAAHLSWLGRPAGVRAKHRQVFQRCRENNRQRCGRQIDPALHGARHGPLPGRPRH
jgi:feruloyl esterase